MLVPEDPGDLWVDMKANFQVPMVQYYGLVNPDDQGICEAYITNIMNIECLFLPEFRDDTEKTVEGQNATPSSGLNCPPATNKDQFR